MVRLLQNLAFVAVFGLLAYATPSFSLVPAELGQARTAAFFGIGVMGLAMMAWRQQRRGDSGAASK